MASTSRMLMGAESTIKGFVADYRTEELTFDAFYLPQVFTQSTGDKLIVNGEDLLVKYMPELKSMIQQITLTESEYKKYMYNPKRLSFDLYGTTELWALLLDINELVSVAQFNLQTLKVFSGSILDKLQRILNLEQEFIDQNAEDVADALLKT